MPHSSTAERQVLGVVLLGTHYASAAEALFAELSPEDFYVPSHARIWRVAAEAWRRHSTGDVATIVRTGEDMGEAMDPVELIEILAASSGVLGAKASATVVDRASRRWLLAALSTAIDNAAEPSVDLGAVTDGLRAALAHVDIPTRTAVCPPDIHDLLVTSEPEYDWLVPGLLERGDRLMVTAREGAGKTLWLRQLAVQLAGGYHPINAREIEPVRVLAVDLENSARQARRWYRILNRAMILHGRMIPEDTLYPVPRPGGLDLLDRSDLRWLMEHCAATKPQVLMIGPVYKLHSGDPHEEAPARKVIAALDRIRDLYGCAIVMETHSPHDTSHRPGRPFGASIWMRWPEFGFALIADKSKRNRFRFVAWRGPRDERGWPAAYAKGGQWPWTPEQRDGPDTDHEELF